MNQSPSKLSALDSSVGLGTWLSYYALELSSCARTWDLDRKARKKVVLMSLEMGNSCCN